ncbi:X-ray repair cross-complementing protein 5-like [Neodiprion fabricii]|uniref:X-ray repair cross-complementing protein 5-like n=1 Tax=Neodiprion fabricii TaxID=2872261 RepID=UPI001ED975C9|nr:X-ray repair cross-complementing protein 5-like [Neodiprion fabricii]
MPPKSKNKEYLIILVNIGCTDETENENETSFFEKSKQVIQLLIKKKIFLRPKDEVGIVLMGASETKNKLLFDNIVEMNSLQVPNWNLVENVINLKCTKEKTNWVDGITVALDYIKRECVEANAARKLVLLTDFKEDPTIIRQYDVDNVVSDINEAYIDLLAITNNSLNADSEIELNPSEEVFANVCKMVEGKILTIDDTLPKLMIYKDHPKKAAAWEVDMDLFDIKIPVIFYLKTTEDFKLPKWKKFTESQTAKFPVQKERTLVDKNKDEIEEENTITGTMYGRKFIPLSDEDKAMSKYQSGPKSLTVYGFTKERRVRLDYLAGKGSHIVVPKLQWASPFYSLVKAMMDREIVAIVRRVYRNNLAPKMGVLIPKIDVPGQLWCLVYIELIFAEDRRILQPKPITSTLNELSDAQKEAVDDLIDSMMLATVENNSMDERQEPFEAGTVNHVSRQYIWDVLAHRALYPDDPLPPMSDFLQKFFEPPQSVQLRSKRPLKDIKTLFPIKAVEKKKNFKKRYEGGPDDLREPFESVDRSTQDLNATTTEKSVDRIAEDSEMEEAQLSLIAEAVEAASQSMDVDLEELAKSM